MRSHVYSYVSSPAPLTVGRVLRGLASVPARVWNWFTEGNTYEIGGAEMATKLLSERDNDIEASLPPTTKNAYVCANCSVIQSRPVNGICDCGSSHLTRWREQEAQPVGRTLNLVYRGPQ